MSKIVRECLIIKPHHVKSVDIMFLLKVLGIGGEAAFKGPVREIMWNDEPALLLIVEDLVAARDACDLLGGAKTAQILYKNEARRVFRLASNGAFVCIGTMQSGLGAVTGVKYEQFTQTGIGTFHVERYQEEGVQYHAG